MGNPNPQPAAVTSPQAQPPPKVVSTIGRHGTSGGLAIAAYWAAKAFIPESLGHLGPEESELGREAIAWVIGSGVASVAATLATVGRTAMARWGISLLVALSAVGCATSNLEQSYWRARGSWVETQTAYNRFIEFDNKQIESCFRSHPELFGKQAVEVCGPILDKPSRDVALEITREAKAEFEEIEPLVGNEDARTAEIIASALGRIESLSIRLLLLYANTSKGESP